MKVFTNREEAEWVARQLQSGELDGWTYEVVESGGWLKGEEQSPHLIMVFDEQGKFAGYWEG